MEVSASRGYLIWFHIIRESYYFGVYIFGVPYFRKPPYGETRNFSDRKTHENMRDLP